MIYTCGVLLFFSGISLYYAIRFGLIILKVQDALEDSLDIIDEKYESISAICERPLFYDSPEVRQVLEDIKETRSSLHSVAHTLSVNFEVDADPEVKEIIKQ